MKTVEVIWSTAASEDLLVQLRREGFEPITTRRVETDIFDDAEDLLICEHMFHGTNTYEGAAWDILQPLPEKRTHTSLSVGDYVVIDERMYRCTSVGWERTDTFEPGLAFSDPREDEF